MNLPERVLSVIAAYDAASGCYRREDGSLDPCHTEVETLEMWNGLLKCIKPKTVVETGVYFGLSTCYIAAALRDSGVQDAKVYSIDPWDLDHYWRESDLEQYIEFLQMTTQEAAPKLAGLEIDVLCIDSIHTYEQSSWELATLEPQVREGGYIIMHDSLFFDGVGRTAKHLYDSPRFEVMTFETPRTSRVPTVDSPVPMGCTIARKIRNGAPFTRDPAWLPVPEGLPAGPLPLLRLDALMRSGV
ncbi:MULTISPECIES: class I SAM-dependent methyltransferase [unclassified Brevundimonas]|uniref:class I SAM-dependent methyltransferase n=1 Tax=unclassified Brevundimonas TaxID=2622653 RepID=UPI0025C2D5E1|nr:MULTISPECIES: class I SAM-dependent methyltransferase [unclassified Brevundimonas]